jgi:hypothetical protein
VTLLVHAIMVVVFMVGMQTEVDKEQGTRKQMAKEQKEKMQWEIEEQQEKRQ